MITCEAVKEILRNFTGLPICLLLMSELGSWSREPSPAIEPMRFYEGPDSSLGLINMPLHQVLIYTVIANAFQGITKWLMVDNDDIHSLYEHSSRSKQLGFDNVDYVITEDYSYLKRWSRKQIVVLKFLRLCTFLEPFSFKRQKIG